MAQNGLLNAGAAGGSLHGWTPKPATWWHTHAVASRWRSRRFGINALRIMEELADMAGEDDYRKRYSTWHQWPSGLLTGFLE